MGAERQTIVVSVDAGTERCGAAVVYVEAWELGRLLESCCRQRK